MARVRGRNEDETANANGRRRKLETNDREIEIERSFVLVDDEEKEEWKKADCSRRTHKGAGGEDCTYVSTGRDLSEHLSVDTISTRNEDIRVSNEISIRNCRWPGSS